MNSIRRSDLDELFTLVGHLARKLERRQTAIDKMKATAAGYRDAGSRLHNSLSDRIDSLEFQIRRKDKEIERLKEGHQTRMERWKELEDENTQMRRELGLHRNLRSLYHDLDMQKRENGTTKRKLKELQEKYGITTGPSR